MPATGWSGTWRGTGSTSARHRESVDPDRVNESPSVAAAASAADSRSGCRYTVRHPEPRRRRRISGCAAEDPSPSSRLRMTTKIFINLSEENSSLSHDFRLAAPDCEGIEKGGGHSCPG